jgi:hypothetical protein
MAVEDVEWQERYGDQSYKPRSLLALRVAFFALFFSQVVVLPSLAVFLSTLHAPTSMLGYCIAATCIGELCANNLFSMWYDGRPAREVVVGALLLNVLASILYSVAPHRIFVLASRFVVGLSCGVQAPLMTMLGALTNRYNRAEVLGGVRATYMLAFIIGAGLSTSVTFVHMHNPGLPLDAMQHSVPTYMSEGRAAAEGEVDSAKRATQKALGEAEFAASRALGDPGNVTISIADRAALAWHHPFKLFSGAGGIGSWESRLSAWEADQDRDLLREVHNDTVQASVLPAALVQDAQGLLSSMSNIFDAGNGAARATSAGASTGSLAARKSRQLSQAAAAARVAREMEHQRKEQERSNGLPTHSDGPVFHFAQKPHAGGARAEEGLRDQGGPLWAEEGGAGGDGGLLTRGLAAIVDDISKRERLAAEALRQANGGAGAESTVKGAEGHGQPALWTDVRALQRALGGAVEEGDGDRQGGQRRLLSIDSWGLARWVEEEVAGSPPLQAAGPILSQAWAGNSSSDAGGEDTGRPAQQIVINGETAPDGSDVETDAQLEKSSGGDSYYLPSYFTAFVGHGLRAPGYLAALCSVVSAGFVWFNLVEGPRKALTKRVPLAHLSPRSLAYFYPLIACVALEFVAQTALVSIEVLVPPLLRMWRGWSCDAIAVFLIAVAASGVMGLALLEFLERRQPLRRLMFWASFLVLLGLAYCLPWNGLRLSAWQFGFGCCLCAFGFVPLSSMANHVVSAAVVKVYSEDGELMWLELFWGLTRVPARALGPIVLVYFLIHDPSGALCYVTLASITSVAIIILFMLRSTLITQGILPRPSRW